MDRIPFNNARSLMTAIVLLIALFMPAFACTAHSQADTGPGEALRRDLNAILDETALRPAHVGIVIESLSTGKRIYEHNGGKLFVPASNMKLFTSAAALLALTPDFRYETGLFTDGTVHSGVLRGNLIIRGSGDPTISGYFNDNNPLYVFQQWAVKLKEMGVGEVRGNIMIDNSIFSSPPYGAGWNTDDRVHCYSAPRDAFSFNNNCVQLDIIPAGKTGGSPKIIMEPDTRFIKIMNAATTGKGQTGETMSFEYTSPGVLRVNGTVAPSGTASTHYIAVRHPAHFGGYVFREALASKGITVKGDIVCARNCPVVAPPPVEKRGRPWRRIAVYRSPVLSEIIKVVNKLSNNLYAELVLLAAGKTQANTAATQEAIAAALSVLRDAGIDTNGLTMTDGSGLSRYNLITPGSVVELLKVMANGPYAPQFIASLPAIGAEGTIKNRLKGSAAGGRVRAKTGTMVHVRNLSGYVTTNDNETLIFSILCNNHDAPVSAIDSAIDRIILRLLGRPG